MSTIFVLGLEDTYTKEQLYQLKPDAGNTTVSFGKLVDAASEIAVDKDNVAEASGSASMSAMSGGDKSNAKCGFYNSESHNANGFTAEARQKILRPLENFVTNVVFPTIFLLHAGLTK